MLTICAIGDANVGFLYEKSILYYTKDIFELVAYCSKCSTNAVQTKKIVENFLPSSPHTRLPAPSYTTHTHVWVVEHLPPPLCM